MVVLNNAFATKGEAERFAFDAAKKWIVERSGSHCEGLAKRTVVKQERLSVEGGSCSKSVPNAAAS